MEQIIIELYLSGHGCTTISEKLNYPKHKILKVLNKNKLIRKRDRCSTLDIKKENDKFYLEWICSVCKQKQIRKAKDKLYLCRNHFSHKTKICKSCSQLLQNGPGNPFFGKKHSDISKEKISKSRKGKTLGEENPMSNPIWKEKARKNLIKKWESGDLEKTRKKMSEIMKNTIRKGKIKSYIKSKKEIEIAKKIREMGFEVKESFRVDTKICDIYVKDLNLIIEYFGDYWHCNPKKYNKNYFNKKKNQYSWEIWEYDKNKVELIQNNGYNLEVIWEQEFKNDINLLKNIINYYVKNKFSTPEWSRKD